MENLIWMILFWKEYLMLVPSRLEEVLFFPTFNDQALFKKFLSEDNPNLNPLKRKKPKGGKYSNQYVKV